MPFAWIYGFFRLKGARLIYTTSFMECVVEVYKEIREESNA